MRPEAGAGPQRVCDDCYDSLRSAGAGGHDSGRGKQNPSLRLPDAGLPPIAVEPSPADALPPVAPVVSPGTTHGTGGDAGGGSNGGVPSAAGMQAHYERVLHGAAAQFVDVHAAQAVAPGALELEPCEDVPELVYATPADGQLAFPVGALDAGSDATLTSVVVAPLPAMPAAALALHAEALERHLTGGLAIAAIA